MFSELKKKKSMLAFLRTLFDYNLARGLAVHARFDDLDLISRSQVCQIHKLQIVFRILVHCSWKKCMVITLLEVYQFIPGLMTLTLFQGHSSVRVINCKLL